MSVLATEARPVLVTGASGFLGGALGRSLRSVGYVVTGVSRRGARSGATDQHRQHDLSLPLPRDVSRYDVVVHAAALTSPGARPADYKTHIIDGTQHVLDYAERTKVGCFVLISTTAVFYVLDNQFGITKEMDFPFEPVNEYAAAKRQAEKMVLERWPDCLIIWPRAIYGPGDTVLFPRTLNAARKGVLPQIVRPDGATARRIWFTSATLFGRLNALCVLGFRAALTSRTLALKTHTLC
ncbi:hypothetical protein CCP2SC5_310037 [Azospirillaceae bacterium]